MSILIFSDTHLHPRFEEKKFIFLKDIIARADRVIINGDFWDGYLGSFDRFIHSEWKRLFPLLKRKHTIYIYGNHDSERFADTRVSLFSDMACSMYRLVYNNKRYVIEHGNRMLPMIDEILRFDRPHPFLVGSYHTLGRLLVRTLKHRFIDFYYRPDNKKIKDRIQKEYLHQEIVICGHTHAAEMSIEERFINSGLVGHGLGQYILLDHNTIRASEQWYE